MKLEITFREHEPIISDTSMGKDGVETETIDGIKTSSLSDDNDYKFYTENQTYVYNKRMVINFVLTGVGD